MNKLVTILFSICFLFTAVSCNAQNNNKQTKIKISTPYGDMIAVLHDQTPGHRDNFIKLINEGFYDSLLFHRVIKSFMIQGGDPASKNAAPGTQLGNGGPGYTIPAEINSTLFHKKGALSAARLGDAQNPKKASSGSQFYIVQGKKYTDVEIEMMKQRAKQGLKNTAFQKFISDPKNKAYADKFNALRVSKDQEGLQAFAKEIDPLLEEMISNESGMSEEQIKAYKETGGTPHLDNGYTVFGQVIEGLDVIDKIAAVKTAPGDRPVEDVYMVITIVK